MGTPRNGFHLGSGCPIPPLNNSVGKLAPGVDTRGAGGYVIAPGCKLAAGGSWKIMSPVTHSELASQVATFGLPYPPAWVIDALQGHPKRLLDGKLTACDGHEVLDLECSKVRKAPEGTRNDALNRAAFAVGQIIGVGTLSRDEAEERLSDAAIEAGLQEREVERTIKSGIEAGISSPITLRGNGTGLVWPEMNDKGKPRPSYANAQVALRALGLTFEHDTFHCRKLIGGQPIGRFAGEIGDDAIAAARDLVVGSYGFDPGKEHLFDAANALCIKNSFDPVCDWLNALEWDGTPRLQTWLVDHAGAVDTPLNRATGELLLVAMVRRAKCPGCKFDIMVVLEGPQGCGKSSLLKVLAGDADNFTDTPVLRGSVKEVAETLRGKWMVEISELVGLGQREVEDIKALITRTDDRARPAYGRYVESQLRRCVFVGTTNAENYLRDDTGNRRFLPVRVGAIDVQQLTAMCDQLFAEAVQVERTYGPLALPQGVWLAAAQEAQERMIPDVWVEQLREALEPGSGWARHALEALPNGGVRILTTKVVQALGLQAKDVRQADYKRMASAMRALGFDQGRWRPIGQQAKARGFIKGP